jgi:hypothetical protein
MVYVLLESSRSERKALGYGRASFWIYLSILLVSDLHVTVLVQL